MIDQFDFWSTEPTFYVLLNWALTLATLTLFLLTYAWRRFLFVKPSLILFLITHVLFQWPFAIYAGFYEKWLPDPYAFVLLVHGFVLIGFAGSALMLVERARLIWNDLGVVEDSFIYLRVVCILLVVVIACVSVYLSYVPIDCTGLYALVFDLASQPLARELSMKLQTAAMPRYLMSFVQTSFVPLITSLVAVDVIRNGWKRPSRALVLCVLAAAAWTMAFIPGAKGTLVSFGLVVAASYLWAVRLSLTITTPVMLTLSLAPALAVATLFSLGANTADVRDIRTCFYRMSLAQGAPREELIESFSGAIPQVSESDPADAAHQQVVMERNRLLHESPGGVRTIYLELANYMRDGVDAAADFVALVQRIVRTAAGQVGTIAFRALVGPFEVGGWYVHNLQANGPFGVAAIPRLARIVGVPPVDVPNMIGKAYGPIYYSHAVAPTISAGAGFIFSYYSYFGMWALPIIILAAWLTDIAVFVLGVLPRPLVLPVLSALSISTLKFAESDFTAVWLTHGFGVILLLGLLLSLLLVRLLPKTDFAPSKT